jgi:hypothetical protein
MLGYFNQELTVKSKKKRRPIVIALKITGGIVLLLILFGLIKIEQLFYSMDETSAKSSVFFENQSGLHVRFDKVIIDNQVVWEDPDVPIPKKDVLDSRFNDHGTSNMVSFSAPERLVKLELETVNDMDETERVSCTLDNRLHPCLFQARYVKGRLFCYGCEKGFR